MPAKRAARRRPMQERLSRSFRRIPAEDTPRLFRLRLAEIEPNPDQPRKQIDQEALRELAASIEQHGLIQPITVKRLPEAGSATSWSPASAATGRTQLSARGHPRHRHVGSADEISLIENIQRQDLHPLEEAAAYARMMERHGWTQEQLAARSARRGPTVTNILKLNRLPEPIREQSMAIVGEGPSKSALFEIARLDSPQAQLALWEKVRAGATVRAARDDSAAVEGSGGKKVGTR